MPIDGNNFTQDITNQNPNEPLTLDTCAPTKVEPQDAETMQSAENTTSINKESGLQIKRKNNQLTKIESAAIESLFTEYFVNGQNNDPRYKTKLIALIKEEAPSISETQLSRLYRKAEHDYFNALSRIPPEALINKVTEQTNALTEKILSDSDEDITKQALAINKLNETVLKANRVYDVAPKVEITFQTNLPNDYLLQPDVIFEAETKNNPKEEQ